MTAILRLWSLYMRLTARVPAVRSVVPFVPVVVLWTAVAESGLFPRVFFPGPLEVVRSFVSLARKGILPDYLEDSVVRLAVGMPVRAVFTARPEGRMTDFWFEPVVEVA